MQHLTNRKTITTAIMMILAITLFISCDKSDDDQEKAPIKEEMLTHVKYFIGEGKDLLKVVNISVTYNDNTGAEQTEAITSLPWTKEYKDMELTLPRVMKMTVKYTKNVSRPEQDNYTLWQESGVSGKTNIRGIVGISALSSKVNKSNANIDVYVDNLIKKEIVRTLEVGKSLN